MEQRTGNFKNGREDEVSGPGFPVHSQVRKIKEEISSRIVDWSPEQPEMGPGLREITRRKQQQRSRSPLGLSAGRAISVGDS